MNSSDQHSGMRGKICLITGATSGIGRVAARELARRGASLMIVSRDRARGEATLAELKAAGGGVSIDLLNADLVSQSSIRALGREVRERTDRLHVLINNAGVICLTRRLSGDGMEATLAINHLAPFLLTQLLQDLLLAGAPSRVVTVASAAHRVGRIDFDDLQGERRFHGFRAYAQSKLANVLFTYELSRRLNGKGVAANCLHPGTVDTNLWRESRGLLRFTLRATRPFFLTAEQGAAGLIDLASSAALEGVTGRYFAKGREARSSRASYDTAAAKRLWEMSAALTGVGS
jgi:NAD(P)-dependent dehydrogenase (short-subunit alcohol dehydrogenase family)